MKKIIFYFLVLSITGNFFSCHKEKVDTIIAINEKSKLEILLSDLGCQDVNCMLNSVKEFDISQEYDAIIFHTGYALQSVFANDKTMEQLFLESHNNHSNSSVSQLCERIPALKQQLNVEIRKSLIENNAYSIWTNNKLSQHLQTLHFDFVSFFDTIISRQENGKELVYYTPSELGHKADFSTLFLGLDISLPNENQALVFKDNTPLILSKAEAENSSNPVVFLGINNKSITTERFNTWIEKKLPKWHHHGRVRLTTNDDIEVWWITKYRWYSSWALKEVVPLTNAGDFDEYYYWGYRITCHVEFWTSDGGHHFRMDEKHWQDDPWINIY